MIRGLEGLVVAVISAITIAGMYASVAWQATPQHQVSSERALAWMLLVSDSAPYSGKIVNMSLAAYGEYLAYLRYGSFQLATGNYSEVYCVKAVWLGYNGTIKPMEVIVCVKP